MTGDDLAAWQRRCGIRTQKEAAHAVRLSLAAYREKLKGRVPVDERTELLCAFHEVFLDLFVGHATPEGERAIRRPRPGQPPPP
jgi:hypothetical protein